MISHPTPLDSSSEQLPSEQFSKQLPVKRPLILAIDDDSDNLLLLSYVLEQLDCEFICQTSGNSALEVAKQRQPDLILLDVILPDMHGTELVHLLKQDGRTSAIPVIAITGLANLEDKTKLLSQGVSEYLSKPYMINELEAIVRRYLPLPQLL